MQKGRWKEMEEMLQCRGYTGPRQFLFAIEFWGLEVRVQLGALHSAPETHFSVGPSADPQGPLGPKTDFSGNINFSVSQLLNFDVHEYSSK